VKKNRREKLIGCFFPRTDEKSERENFPRKKERKKKKAVAFKILVDFSAQKSQISFFTNSFGFGAERRSREKMSAMLSSRRVSVHVPGGGGGGGTKAAFSRRSAFFSGMRPLHRTAVKKSSSSSRRPKNAGRRRMISSSSSSRDLFEGDEGFDVELLQKDLVEEGLLDQKHANGYVKEFRRDIFLFLLFPNGRKT
jgi:hypothetical protein